MFATNDDKVKAMEVASTNFDQSAVEREEFHHYLCVIIGFEEVEGSVLEYYQAKFTEEYNQGE